MKGLVILAVCLCTVILVLADTKGKDGSSVKTSPPRRCRQFRNCLKCSLMRCTKCNRGYRLQRLRFRPRYSNKWTCVRSQTNTCNLRCHPNFQCKRVNGRPTCIRRCPRFCPEIYRPVCGSDGKTYSNACDLRRRTCNGQKRVTVRYQRRCRDIPRCGPICAMFCRFGFEKDSNGCPICKCRPAPACRRFPNCNKCTQRQCTECKPGFYKMQRQQWSRSYCTRRCLRGYVPQNSTCVRSQGPICQRACPRIYKPVCGSDGKTYSNKCLLDLRACLTNTRKTVKYQGRCQGQGQQCSRFPNCEKCTRFWCFQCKTGYNKLRQGRRVQCFRVCPGRYTQRNATCVLKPGQLCTRFPNCEKCTRFWCFQCKTGYNKLRQGRRVQCVRVCPSRYTQRNGLCVLKPGQQCSRFPNCEKCTRFRCFQCKTGYNKLRQGRRVQCLRVCPSQYTQRNGTCVPDCNRFPKCGRCTIYHCTRCNLGYYLMPRRSPGGRCVSSCPAGYQQKAGKCYPVAPVNPCQRIRCNGSKQCKLVMGKPRCVEMCTSPMPCTREYKPVCGTDNKTYGNECVLRASACASNSYVGVAYRGACRRPTPPAP